MTYPQLHTADAGTASDSRWTGVGRSNSTDSFDAGFEAASAAGESGGASLYIVFAGHRHDHEAVVAGVAAVASADAAIIGSTTGAEDDLGRSSGDGIVVMAIGGQGISVATRRADIVGGDLRTAGEQVADSIWEVEDRGHTVLLLLADGLAGDQQDVMRGAYATAGATIPLVGGCAGDAMGTGPATLFHADRNGTRIGGGQVIGATISSTGPIGIGVFHGWQRVGEPVLITRSVGNVIHEIDGEPALDRYLLIHDAPAELGNDADAFAQFAATHPLGISRHSGEEIRLIASADPAARTVTSVAVVAQGVVAHAMKRTAESAAEATEIACAEALAMLTGPPVGVVVFGSVDRQRSTGTGENIDEANRMAARLGAPIVGFSTCGEFARLNGAAGYHNRALVALAIG